MLLTRWFSVASLTLAVASSAQTGEPAPRVIVVPMPGDVTDAGVAQAAPEVTVPVPVAAVPVDAGAPLADAPMATVDGGVPMESSLTPSATANDPSAQAAVVPDSSITGNGMMLDGHPREGSFLSGPGSLTFLVHHTLMTVLGRVGHPNDSPGHRGGLRALATSPRRLPSHQRGPDADARLLRYFHRRRGPPAIGAGMRLRLVAAWWQFNHWISSSHRELRHRQFHWWAGCSWAASPTWPP